MLGHIALLQSLALRHVPVLHPPWVPTLSSPLDHNEVHLYLLYLQSGVSGLKRL